MSHTLTTNSLEYLYIAWHFYYSEDSTAVPLIIREYNKDTEVYVRKGCFL